MNASKAKRTHETGRGWLRDRFRFGGRASSLGLVAGCCWLWLWAVAGAQSLRLEKFPAGGAGAGFRELESGGYEITGPMSVLATTVGGAAPGAAAEGLVLEFEAFCIGGVPAFAVLPGPPYQAATHRRLPAIGHSEVWTPYAARLAWPEKPMPEGWKSLRLDLPLPAGRVLQMRHVRLRPERPGEFEMRAKAPTIGTEELLSYLDGAFPGRIEHVAAGAEQMLIRGRYDGAAEGLRLAEVPMEYLENQPERFESIHELRLDGEGRFVVSLPRLRDRQGRPHDRLLSRWQLVVKDADGRIRPRSHARYADQVHCQQPELPAVVPASKKGLGGWHAGRIAGELEELGIAAVTVNVMIHSLVALQPGPGTQPFEWQGRTWHARQDALERLDRTFREAAGLGAQVSAILLVANPARSNEPVVRKLGHPDAEREGTFAMPNVTDPEGIALYGAILRCMAERWSRADGKYGRVHHWIMHNEVDAARVWTNAGNDKSAETYVDLLQRSMRLMHLIAAQYDPHARPFLSLTHHWAHPGPAGWYGSKRMIDLLARFGAVEGDFPWAVAHHPYPQDLRNPRTWEDHQATFDFETAKITPRNLEVLDAYMRREALRYRGQVRPVHLTENGFNSPDYSEASLADQAAGMAYAWKKIQRLDSIEVWHYHNWVDHRGEGSLRIGLRKFPDEPGDPLGKKPIWYLYRALGTPEEEEACRPWLARMGMRSWEEIHHPGPIPEAARAPAGR